MSVDRLAYGPLAEQFGELYDATTSPRGTVVVIHGGFWRLPWDLHLMDGLSDDLARRGFAAWNIEYRRLGSPGGGWPGTFEDAAAAAAYIGTRPDAARPLLALGHSAGGHLALWLGAEHAVDGVISLAGVSDLRAAHTARLGGGAASELLGGTPRKHTDRYSVASPAARLPLGVPQVVIHGTADDRVPVEMSRVYAAAAHAAGDRVRLVELPGVDHFAVIDPACPAWATIAEETERLADSLPAR